MHHPIKSQSLLKKYMIIYRFNKIAHKIDLGDKADILHDRIDPIDLIFYVEQEYDKRKS